MCIEMLDSCLVEHHTAVRMKHLQMHNGRWSQSQDSSMGIVIGQPNFFSSQEISFLDNKGWWKKESFWYGH